MDQVRLRIIDDLLRYKGRKKSWSAFAEDIARANPEGLRVDRRKLQRLCEKRDEEVSLSILELRAINEYLRSFSEGAGLDQKPIFIREEDILDSVAENDALTIFVATRYHNHPDMQTETVSGWDMRAVTNFTGGKLARKKIEIQDVLFREEGTDKTSDKKWVKSLDTSSVKITIGSPLANPATEFVLSQMIGRQPYEKRASDLDHSLPFYFLFLDQECGSIFFIKREDKARASTLVTEREADKLKALGDGQRAIIISKEIFISEPKRQGRSYGLFVAQRQRPRADQRHGDVLMSVCGTYGPTTLAVSMAVAENKVKSILPPFNPKADLQPILVAVIEAKTVPRDTPGSKQNPPQEENRELHGKSVIGTPRILHFSKGRWSETLG